MKTNSTNSGKCCPNLPASSRMQMPSGGGINIEGKIKSAIMKPNTTKMK